VPALAAESLVTSQRTRVIGATLGALALLLIGYAVGWLTPRLSTPGQHSPEAGFARDMSEHHAQAVELGMIAYQKAALPEVRTLGGDPVERLLSRSRGGHGEALDTQKVGEELDVQRRVVDHQDAGAVAHDPGFSARASSMRRTAATNSFTLMGLDW